MGAFGASTPKATRLYSNADFAVSLLKWPLKRDAFNNQSDVCRDRYIDKSGKRRMHGGKGLKQTQAYPPGFGDAVASSYLGCKHLFGPPSAWVDLTESDPWADARIGDMIRDLAM
jgi:hypothetical protein